MTDTNDNSRSKPKQVIDLDAISNTKPKKNYFSPDSRVDFSLTSEQNKDRYISVGQIQEVMKMPAAEKKRVMQNSLTDKHIADIEGLGKSTAKTLSKLKTGLVFPSVADMLPKPPSYDFDLGFDVTSPPSGTEQYKQTALLKEMVATLQSQNSSADPAILALVVPRYDKRKHILTFANIPVRIPVDTPAELICKRMFRSSVPVKKPVEKGDLFELLGLMEIAPKTRRVKLLYNRVDRLNKIVAKATGVNDLFGFVDKKLYFNTNYVKLPL